jgi:hypothetical protein
VRRPAAHEWEALCDDIVALAARLREDGPAILGRVGKARLRDGYPTRSMGGDGGPASVLDDRGVPMPPLNDPVGELVVAGPQAEPDDRAAARTLLDGMLQARRQLQRAESVLIDVDDEIKPADGCTSCSRFDVWSIVFRAARCRFCYDWRRSDPHLQDPPELEVLAHHDRRHARNQQRAS